MQHEQRVYGCGFNYGSDNMMDDFIDEGIACIGHSFEDASALYTMMAEVNVGDIIFLKVTNYTTGLWVHATGIVTELPCIQRRYNGTGENLGIGIKVEWVDTGWSKLKLGKGHDKYDHVRKGAFFREFNAKFIHRIKRMVYSI